MPQVIHTFSVVQAHLLSLLLTRVVQVPDNASMLSMTKQQAICALHMAHL